MFLWNSTLCFLVVSAIGFISYRLLNKSWTKHLCTLWKHRTNKGLAIYFSNWENKFHPQTFASWIHFAFTCKLLTMNSSFDFSLCCISTATCLKSTWRTASARLKRKCTEFKTEQDHAAAAAAVAVIKTKTRITLKLTAEHPTHLKLCNQLPLKHQTKPTNC